MTVPGRTGNGYAGSTSPSPVKEVTMLRAVAAAVLAVASPAAFATSAIPIALSAPVPGLGFAGVLATGIAAAVIGWWRMRK